MDQKKLQECLDKNPFAKLGDVVYLMRSYLFHWPPPQSLTLIIYRKNWEFPEPL